MNWLHIMKFTTIGERTNREVQIMGRVKCSHAVPLTMFFMVLALIGWPVLEFIFVAMVAITIGATMFYGFLFFAHLMDRVIDYFYEMR